MLPNRLLALDGGGVRGGLSSLMILRRLMTTVNPNAPPKPCDYFDLIGGTGTGGLIAVMLGRMQMTVDECFEAYESVFNQVLQQPRWPGIFQGKIQGRYADNLKRAIKQILVGRGLSEDALLKDLDASCKVFVCATSKETSGTVCLASYPSPRSDTDLLNSTTIWQACRATTARPTIFDPIAIGRFGEEFVDGALGANNLVDALWNQAQDMWDNKLEANLKCLVSIGTGLSLQHMHDDVLGIWATSKELATDTEKTAKRFRRDKSRLVDTGRYYRFNVDSGLEGTGLEESKEKKEIKEATQRYVELAAVVEQMKACAETLARRESK